MAQESMVEAGLALLQAEFGEERVAAAVEAVKKFQVEVPSWIFGEFGGGRFGEYMPPGAALNIEQKLDDAAFVNKLTDATGRVATHVLWDLSEDGINGSLEVAKRVKTEVQKRGSDLGSISPTYFLKGSHRGSLSSEDKPTRERYLAQTILAGTIAKELANGLITLWFPDGSSYPGQRELRTAYENITAMLKEARSAIPDDVRMLIEYKVFEPGTYSTTIPDWGAAAQIARDVGGNTGALVDLGHHHHGTNIEQIVAMLIATGVPCGFHFNTRYAADDDHAVEPNAEMARIFYELVSGDVISSPDDDRNWAFMIDQCSSRENRIHAVLHSVDSLQVSLARAMLLNEERLHEYQHQDEVILANRCANNALLLADVRPIVWKARTEKDLPLDPVRAYVDSGYQKRIEAERK
jgi:L-rhamnose isomerase/sugar isomerase